MNSNQQASAVRYVLDTRAIIDELSRTPTKITGSPLDIKFKSILQAIFRVSQDVGMPDPTLSDLREEFSDKPEYAKPLELIEKAEPSYHDFDECFNTDPIKVEYESPPIPIEAYHELSVPDAGTEPTQQENLFFRFAKPVNQTLVQSEIPPRKWIVKDWIPHGEVVGFSGAGGTGKSRYAQQLCTAIATGAIILGTKCEKRRCAYVTCEDNQEEVDRRQKELMRHYGFDGSETDGFMWAFSLRGEDVILANMRADISDRTPRIKELESFVEQNQIEFLVLDLIPDFWTGNEIDRNQVNRFVKYHLAGIATKYNCTVFGLFHPSRSGMNDKSGTSGSTAWDGSYRARLAMQRASLDQTDDNYSIREICLKKGNYSPDVKSHYVEWNNGAFVHSDYCPKSEIVKTTKTPSPTEFADMLNSLWPDENRDEIPYKELRELIASAHGKSDQNRFAEQWIRQLPNARDPSTRIRSDGGNYIEFFADKGKQNAWFVYRKCL